MSELFVMMRHECFKQMMFDAGYAPPWDVRARPVCLTLARLLKKDAFAPGTQVSMTSFARCLMGGIGLPEPPFDDYVTVASVFTPDCVLAHVRLIYKAASAPVSFLVGPQCRINSTKWSQYSHEMYAMTTAAIAEYGPFYCPPEHDTNWHMHVMNIFKNLAAARQIVATRRLTLSPQSDDEAFPSSWVLLPSLETLRFLCDAKLGHWYESMKQARWLDIYAINDLERSINVIIPSASSSQIERLFFGDIGLTNQEDKQRFVFYLDKIQMPRQFTVQDPNINHTPGCFINPSHDLPGLPKDCLFEAQPVLRPLALRAAAALPGPVLPAVAGELTTLASVAVAIDKNPLPPPYPSVAMAIDVAIDEYPEMAIDENPARPASPVSPAPPLPPPLTEFGLVIGGDYKRGKLDKKKAREHASLPAFKASVKTRSKCTIHDMSLVNSLVKERKGW